MGEGGEALRGECLTSDPVRALLTQLIDYAGLYPPAKLDMPATVSNYARYRAGEDAWMLGRLIIPVARLDELEEAALTAMRQSAADETGPWSISAVTAPAGSVELESDIARIDAFNNKHEDDDDNLAVIDAIELKADNVAAIDSALDRIGPHFPFFEIPLASDPKPLIEAMAGEGCGAKVRTGGASADAIPSAAQVAHFIHCCASAGVSFKATAGMHHPLPHPLPLGEGRVRAGTEGNADSSAPSPQPSPKGSGSFEHGFLNVFIAAGLALTDELSERDIRAILEEQSIDAFAVDEGAIRWRNHALRSENIQDVREEFAVSFGSCSFDEPREDLRNLGLLEPLAAQARD